METDGGHVFEMDDTPGAERVQIFHRKGSFIEFHPDGSIVHRGAQDRYHIILNNENLYVGGNMNMSVVGAVNLSLIHISEPTRQAENSYAVFCL